MFAIKDPTLRKIWRSKLQPVLITTFCLAVLSVLIAYARGDWQALALNAVSLVLWGLLLEVRLRMSRGTYGGFDGERREIDDCLLKNGAVKTTIPSLD